MDHKIPKEYNVILDWLENHLTATGDNVLIMVSICKKLKHRYKKIKSKKGEKSEKEKALHAYNEQCKQQCRRYKYGHKPGDWRCPEKINVRGENDKKTEYKIRKFEGICYHCGQ